MFLHVACLKFWTVLDTRKEIITFSIPNINPKSKDSVIMAISLYAIQPIKFIQPQYYYSRYTKILLYQSCMFSKLSRGTLFQDKWIKLVSLSFRKKVRHSSCYCPLKNNIWSSCGPFGITVVINLMKIFQMFSKSIIIRGLLYSKLDTFMKPRRLDNNIKSDYRSIMNKILDYMQLSQDMIFTYP